MINFRCKTHSDSIRAQIFLVKGKLQLLHLYYYIKHKHIKHRKHHYIKISITIKAILEERGSGHFPAIPTCSRSSEIVPDLYGWLSIHHLPILVPSS